MIKNGFIEVELNYFSRSCHTASLKIPLSMVERQCEIVMFIILACETN
jgi:hypothetical protein